MNLLGLVACEAALRHGGAWRRALLEKLRVHRDRVHDAICAIPGLRTTPVEATFLAWIDARETGRADPHGDLEAAGVGLTSGRGFGPDGLYDGFVRLNFACSRAVLEEALARMRAAFAG